MPEMMMIDKAELANLEERARKLAADKSFLQLTIHLMNKLSAVSGLDNVIEDMLRSVSDVIGGTNLILYHRIDNAIYYADVYGTKKTLAEVDDPRVKTAWETREPAEYEHDFSDTQMMTPEFSKAYTWIFPLLVGPDLIGVFKMESLHISMRELSQQLPTFFSYAAHVLKNEILGHTRLKHAYDDLAQEMTVRKQAEEELRLANESLEERVVARTAELQTANEQLRENEKQIKFLLDQSEQSRRALLSILEDEKRVEAALRESEGHIKQLIEASPVAMLVSSGIDEQVVLVNKKFGELFGYTIEDMPDVAHWWSLAYPDEKYREKVRTLWAARAEYAIRNQTQIEPMEAIVTCKDGDIRYIEFQLSSIGERHLVVFNDLTARKYAEQALNEREKHSQALLRLSRNLERAQTYEQVLNAARDEVRNIIGYQNLWAYLLTQDKKYFKSLVAGGPMSDTVMSETGTATLTIQGDQMLEEIAEAKAIVVVEDAQTDTRVNKEIVARLGNRTIVNVPILLFDRHMGAVGTGTFGDEGVRIPTKPEQEFLMALASHMAVALDRIHLLNQRKQTEEALRQSEAGLREAQRLGRLGSWNWDATTDIITWSEEYYHIYGLDPTQRPPGYEEHLKAYTPESAARLDAAVKRNMETGEPYVIDLELVHPDAPSRWITARSETKRNDKGQIVGLRGTAQDITERKQAEDALRASEIRYRRLVELAPYLIAVHFNGNLVFVNEAGAKLFGAATPEQVIGQPVAQFVSPAHRDVSAERIKQGLALGERSPLYEQKVIRLDGTEIDVEVAGVAFPYRDGMAIQIVMQDITERKRAEEALRRLNRELQAISTCNQVLIRAEDEQTLLSDICHIICDEAGYRMAWVGYAENDDAKTVRPVAWAGFEDGYLASANITWADTERGRGPSGTAIRRGESICTQDFAADPQAAPWRASALPRGYRSSIALPLKDENAKTFGVLNIYSMELNAFTPDEIRLLDELAGDLAFGIGVLRARTERRRAEEALRQEHQNYVTLVNSIDGIVWEADAQTFAFNFVSHQAERLLGYPIERWLAESTFWKDHLHPDDQEWAVNFCMQAVREKRPHDFEYRMLAADGRVVWMRDIVTIVVANDQPVRLRGIMLDTTERRRAEEALRESEEVYRKLVAASPDAITGTDLAGQITLVSPKAIEMFGLSPDDNVLERSIFDWVAPEDMERAAANMQHLLTTGQMRYREFVLRKKDGTYFDGEVNAALIQAADGTPKGTIIITRDITERKRAEQKANQLAAIVQSSEDAVIGKTPDGIITSWNRGAEKIYGYAESEVIGKPISILVLPSHEDQVPQILEKIKAGEHIEHYEAVRRRKDGREIQMSLTISPVRDAEGKIVAASTIGRDITERQRAEQERLAHLRFFETMDQINRAMQRTNDLEQMMSDVLDVVLSIFGCDRAWLVNPCDPETVSWQVPMERTRPGYPGAFDIGREIPTAPDVVRTFRILLDSEGPVKFGPASEYPLPEEIAKQFGIQSQIAMAIYSKVDKPYVFGLHQCSYPRIWTPEEERLFQEIGRRLSDSLGSLLMYRNLRESEERFATAFHLSPIAISIVRAADGRFVDVNDAFVKTSGYTREEIIGRTSNELQLWAHPEKQAPRMRQLQEQGSTGTFEFTVRTKTGENRIGLSATAQIDLGGEKHYLSLIYDITDRKQAEEALRANEARFRALVENSSEIITILNADGTARYESPAHERLLGYTSDEMIGAYPLALVHPDDLPGLLDIFVTGIQVPKYTAHAEYRMRHKDGTWRTMEMVACNLLEDPAVEGIVVNSRDITERMSAEAELAKYREHLEELVAERTQQLRESEQHYRQLFETMLQGVVYQDANGKIISMNPAAERILGVTSAELLGTISMENKSDAYREDGSLFPKPEHPATVTQLTGQEVHNVVMGIRNARSQTFRWINVSAVAVFRSGEDKPYQVYTLFDDITERKLAEVQIRKLNQDLQERAVALEAANKELEAFAYSVSHDLRAPLRHIDGFLELFQTKTASQLDERSQHYLENISDAAKRMGTLIDDLLSFSRMGRYEMSKLRVDLGGLTQEVIREFEPETGGRNIHLQIADLPVVTGDRAMLRIVLVNLISNALKFTQPREQTEIEIGWMREEETGTVIFVRDNGVGFDPRYADKLFGVFQRLHRADEFEGTGIGLANVRRIISRHGGRTWAEGQVNQGATVYFSLPQTNQGG